MRRIVRRLSKHPVFSVPINTSLPVISGVATSFGVGIILVFPISTSAPEVGQELSAFNGVWANNPTSFTYQWNSSSGGAIGGATDPTYTPISGDIGNTLTVTVIAINGPGFSAPATSASTTAVIA